MHMYNLQSEVESGYLVEQANMYGYILLACDWWGMAEYDVPAVAAMIAEDLGDFRIIPDRLTQAMVNAHMLMRLAKVKAPSPHPHPIAPYTCTLTLSHHHTLHMYLHPITPSPHHTHTGFLP